MKEKRTTSAASLPPIKSKDGQTHLTLGKVTVWSGWLVRLPQIGPQVATS